MSHMNQKIAKFVSLIDHLTELSLLRLPEVDWSNLLTKKMHHTPSLQSPSWPFFRALSAPLYGAPDLLMSDKILQDGCSFERTIHGLQNGIL